MRNDYFLQVFIMYLICYNNNSIATAMIRFIMYCETITLYRNDTHPN